MNYSPTLHIRAYDVSSVWTWTWTWDCHDMSKEYKMYCVHQRTLLHCYTPTSQQERQQLYFWLKSDLISDVYPDQGSVTCYKELLILLSRKFLLDLVTQMHWDSADNCWVLFWIYFIIFLSTFIKYKIIDLISDLQGKILVILRVV